MRYWIFVLALLWAAFTNATTHAQRLAELDAANGVLAAWLVGSFQPVSGTDNISTASYRYLVVSGSVVTDNTVRVLAVDFGTQTEAVYWAGNIPEPLRVTPAPVYFSARTTGAAITAAQIQTYCNNKWETLHAGTDDILDFQVVPVRGDTVLVSGVFDMGDNTWKQMSIYITLVNPNAASPTADANVKFKVKVEA